MEGNKKGNKKGIGLAWKIINYICKLHASNVTLR